MNLTGTALSNSRVEVTQTKSLNPSSSRVLYSRISESASKNMAIKGKSKNLDLNSDLSASKSERFKSMNNEIPKESALTSVA